MKADPLTVGQILHERQRFIVPIYQRTYSWTVKKQLQTLMQQVTSKAALRLAGQRSPYGHYMGALLVIPEGEATFGRIQPFYVVDGQQRLTTFHLLFAALRDIARSIKATAIEPMLADLLVHSDQTPMQDPANERYKLQPTKYDRAIFRDLIDRGDADIRQRYKRFFYKNGNIKEGAAPLTLRAWHYFRQACWSFVCEEDDAAEREKRLSVLSKTLFEDFRLIVITLGRDDDAQVIFETLNHGGEPLTAMDLVRNDVFHRAASRGVNLDQLLEEHWGVFETAFWKEEQVQGRMKKPRIDFYLAHTLAAEQGGEVLLSELYAAYKDFVGKSNFASPEEELQLLTRHAETYRMLVAPEGAGSLARLARRLNLFDVSTAYPLVFVVEDTEGDDEEKARIYELIASYIYRRALCGLTPKSYNKTFIRLARVLAEKGVSEQILSAEFMNMTGDAVRFPDDVEVTSRIEDKEMYTSIVSHRLRVILEELELSSRGRHEAGSGLVPGLTIEHILPDSWMEYWPLPDGRVAPADRITGVDESMHAAIVHRDRMKHTLGNLTLLTSTGNHGNDSFDSKKPRIRASGLSMNIGIADLAKWDEADIKARGQKLAALAVKVWPGPKAPTQPA